MIMGVVALWFIFPLLDGIVLGIVFAYIAQPVKKRLEKKAGPRISAFLSAIFIILPITLILILGIVEIISQAGLLMNSSSTMSENFNSLASNFNVGQWEFLKRITDSTSNFLISTIKSLPLLDYAMSTVMLVMNGFIAIVVCYYILADGRGFARIVKKFSSEESYAFLEKTNKRIQDVLVGNFYSAIIISMISFPFFIYFDIPFWAIAMGFMFLAAMIPIFAEWMVLLPISFYVLLTSDFVSFTAFLSIGVVFLYLIPEFLIRPPLVGKLSSTPPVLILVSFIGGGLMFGISGFFLAPMAFCLLYELSQSDEPIG